jgi:hypothetical protein
VVSQEGHWSLSTFYVACGFKFGIHSALVRINEELLERKVAALV